MTTTPDPQTARDDDTFCPHTTYPLQVTLSLLESDLTVRHVDCGRVVVTDWPYLRAHEVPLELAYARDDADEDWLELCARPVEQPQDERVTDAAPYLDLPTDAEFAAILADGSADAELMAFRRLVATVGVNRAYRKWSELLHAGERAEYQEEIDRLIGESVKAEQPQDERDARIAELEREVRQLRAGAPRAWKQDLRSPVGRFENFVNATRNYDSDHLGGIMRGGNAEATITLGDLRAVLARLAELETAQDERDGDVRAVAALLEYLAAFGDAPITTRQARKVADLFADRFDALATRDAAALEARDAKGGES